MKRFPFHSFSGNLGLTFLDWIFLKIEWPRNKKTITIQFSHPLRLNQQILLHGQTKERSDEKSSQHQYWFFNP